MTKGTPPATPNVDRSPITSPDTLTLEEWLDVDLDQVATIDAPAEAVAASTSLPRIDPTPFWFQFASCRPEYADRPLDQWVDLFFPARGESSREAKAICAECPAQEACLDHGMAANERNGIWGATTEKQRRRLRRDRGAA